MASTMNGAAQPAAAHTDSKTTEEDKLWSSLQKDSSDFNTWVKLVDMVDEQGNLDKIRRASTGLLTEFPLCFGYWNKWADHELFHDESKAIEVFEKAVAAAPHCLELWVHYCDVMLNRPSAGNEERVRSVFQRAADVIGSDYRASEFWDKYLNFELARTPVNMHLVAQVYRRILATPLASLEDFHSRFKVFSESCNWEDLATPRELDDLVAAKPDDDEKNPDENKDVNAEKRATVLKRVEDTYTQTVALKAARETFEAGIARPYFHVLPHTQAEMQLWHSYLDFEEKATAANSDNAARTIKLYERCLVACALYVEFWKRYARFLERQGRTAEANAAFSRAQHIFLKREPALYLEYARFQERHGHPEQARVNYQHMLKLAPTLLEGILAFANFERRQGNHHAVVSLYENAAQTLSSDKDSVNAFAFLSMHHARYHLLVRADEEKAREVYENALLKVGANEELWLSYIHFEMSRLENHEERVSSLFERSLASDSLTEEFKSSLVAYYLDYLNDRVPNLNRFVEVEAKYGDKAQKLSSTAVLKKRKHEDGPDGNPSKMARTANSTQNRAAAAEPMQAYPAYPVDPAYQVPQQQYPPAPVNSYPPQYPPPAQAPYGYDPNYAAYGQGYGY